MKTEQTVGGHTVYTGAVTASEFAEFVAFEQRKVSAYYAKQFPTLPVGEVKVEIGRRYARVFSKSTTSTSVVCFVDMTNGNVLKAHGWKSPVPHSAHGNVHAMAEHGSPYAAGLAFAR